FYKFGALAMLFVGAGVYSQEVGRVGINTTEPKAILDIVKEKGKKGPSGILIPRLSADEVKTMTDDNHVGEDQNSLLLYITDLFSDSKNKIGKYELIDKVGYYYWDNKEEKWKRISDESLLANNGLTKKNNTIKLGGRLIENTQLDLNQKDLALENGRMYASGGGFIIDNNTRKDGYNHWAGLDIFQYREAGEDKGHANVNLIGGQINKRGEKIDFSKVDYVPAGRILGGVGGFDAKSFSEANPAYSGASIEFYSAEQFTETAKGTGVNFNVIPKGQVASKTAMTITEEGRVGIGTFTPTEKLHIKDGHIKIEDGTQQEGRVLTSDANGVGTWQALSMGNKITSLTLQGNLEINTASIAATNDNPILTRENLKDISFDVNEIGLTYTNDAINIDKGKYIFFINHDIAGQEYCQVRLNDKSGNVMYNTYYGEWLNATAFVNLKEPDSLYFDIRCFAAEKNENEEGTHIITNPSPKFYKDVQGYKNAEIYNKVTILKLN
ncbi:hypothetical protein MWN41_11115, partial [Ornithobacterium rhinotracheale]|nr:hypothetical protein [Ornithobacterium rhinotracheale]